MMKRFLLFLCGLALAVAASAQDDILDRLKAANAFETLQLSFVQTRHSAMLTKDLRSEGSRSPAAVSGCPRKRTSPRPLSKGTISP